MPCSEPSCITEENRASGDAKQPAAGRHVQLSNQAGSDGDSLAREGRGAGEPSANPEVGRDQAEGSVRAKLVMACAAGLLLLAGFITEQMHGPAVVSGAAVAVAFVLGGIPGVKAAWTALSERRVGIDVLMVIGAVLAVIIGEPMEGALLLFLFALSGAMEEEATRRARTAIRTLQKLNPTEAIVLDAEGNQERVPTKDVALGAKVLVRPGDQVPLDGVVAEGESAVDEAPITGESVPRSKAPGDSVYAGTINASGRLIVEVTRGASDTQLARIIRLVMEAGARRPKVERFIDRVSGPYSISVIVASLVLAGAGKALGLSWHDAVYRAIGLLIVASPCALIIATPIAYLSAIACAARRGVLIKGGAYLEVLARCRTILFDKTGTLTEGKPKLAAVTPMDGLDEGTAVALAAGLESASSHPLASAVMAALASQGGPAADFEEVENVPGRGLIGQRDGTSVRLGQAEWASESLDMDQRSAIAEVARAQRERGRTAAVLAADGSGAVLAFEDPLRADAAETMRRLREQGYKQLVMLTGDHEVVARATASRLGLDGFFADLMPEQKLAHAESLPASRRPIAMVGDGVNDAPLLARADVGIAMASIGADAALEAAPIVLMNNRLERLAWLTGHAGRTARIVRQNLFLAMSVIVVLSGFAVMGKIDLPAAVIAHEGSTVVVALNALRLLRG